MPTTIPTGAITLIESPADEADLLSLIPMTTGGSVALLLVSNADEGSGTIRHSFQLTVIDPDASTKYLTVFDADATLAATDGVMPVLVMLKDGHFAAYQTERSPKGDPTTTMILFDDQGSELDRRTFEGVAVDQAGLLDVGSGAHNPRTIIHDPEAGVIHSINMKNGRIQKDTVDAANLDGTILAFDSGHVVEVDSSGTEMVASVPTRDGKFPSYNIENLPGQTGQTPVPAYAAGNVLIIPTVAVNEVDQTKTIDLTVRWPDDDDYSISIRLGKIGKDDPIPQFSVFEIEGVGFSVAVTSGLYTYQGSIRTFHYSGYEIAHLNMGGDYYVGSMSYDMSEPFAFPHIVSGVGPGDFDSRVLIAQEHTLQQDGEDAYQWVLDQGGPRGRVYMGGNGTKLDDYLTGYALRESMHGGDGDDRIHGGGHDDTLWGDGGNDQLFGGSGKDELWGGTGDDQLVGNGELYGESGDDILEGVGKLFGGEGNDILEGGGKLRGDDGNDIISGSGELVGGNGNDILKGDGALKGGTGDDHIVGGDRSDRLLGGSGSDKLEGGEGADELLGGRDKDVLKGDDGDDALHGDEGRDVMGGGRGSDFLHGGDGNDRISGGPGDDRLFGGTGKDELNGGVGRDQLTGGADADLFVFNELKDLTVSPGLTDIILDFKRRHGDRINLKEIDAKTGKKNHAFSFIGQQEFTDTKGELRYDKEFFRTVIYGDVNGDGRADFAIELDKRTTLQAEDFIL